jgi:anti-sigma B factor antagonist
VGATWSISKLSDEQTLLAVRGDIDLVAEAPLVEQVDELLSEHAGELLLDLAEVDFIDSSGVRALIRVHQAHGDRVRLTDVSTPVRRVLDIAGLTDRLGVDRARGD